jgi:hypothetical protein
MWRGRADRARAAGVEPRSSVVPADEEMRKRPDTKFITITHNPITMVRMNRLFGVTMAEVSQIVSVGLAEAERLLEVG